MRLVVAIPHGVDRHPRREVVLLQEVLQEARLARLAFHEPVQQGKAVAGGLDAHLTGQTEDMPAHHLPRDPVRVLRDVALQERLCDRLTRAQGAALRREDGPVDVGSGHELGEMRGVLDHVAVALVGLVELFARELLDLAGTDHAGLVRLLALLGGVGLDGFLHGTGDLGRVCWQPEPREMLPVSETGRAPVRSAGGDAEGDTAGHGGVVDAGRAGGGTDRLARRDGVPGGSRTVVVRSAGDGRTLAAAWEALARLDLSQLDGLGDLALDELHLGLDLGLCLGDLGAERVDGRHGGQVGLPRDVAAVGEPRQAKLAEHPEAEVGPRLLLDTGLGLLGAEAPALGQRAPQAVAALVPLKLGTGEAYLGATLARLLDGPDTNNEVSEEDGENLV